MNKLKTYGFFAVAAFQALSLLGMIGFKYSVALTGTEAVLESVPVDPRDLLRGDFVRLNLAIGNLQLNELAGDDSFAEGDVIYVVLEKNQPAWSAVRVSAELPDTGQDEAVIKGKVTEINGLSARVDYGIDSYFVPEDTGHAVERVRYWKVKLDRHGHAVLEGPAP